MHGQIQEKAKEAARLRPPLAGGAELIANYGYRPRDTAVLAANIAKFRKLELFDVDTVFGGWDRAQAEHFADGGIFDRLLEA